MDNGVEMDAMSEIEATDEGEVIANVFYADPYRSNQKGSIERNHEFIRWIIDKGISLDQFTNRDFTTVFSHINSYRREVLGMERPIDLARQLLGQKFLEKLGLRDIPARDVILRPELLLKRK